MCVPIHVGTDAFPISILFEYRHTLGFAVDVEHSFTNVNFVVQHKINCGGIRWVDIARIQSRIVFLHPGGLSLLCTRTRANT